MLDQINKRKAAYTSGKRCGDSEERCTERAEEQAREILEKYIDEGAEKQVGLPEDMKAKLLDPDEKLDTPGAFSSASTWLEQQIEDALKTL